MQRSITDIEKRLTAVETETLANSAMQTELFSLKQVSDSLATKSASLLAGQADLEDRMQRDNLLFCGLPDEPSEKWDETETKLLNAISSTMKLVVRHDEIERPHRIASFSPNKSRSVIAKFSSFKTRQNVLFSAARLRDSGISISEDYSLPTRQARKKTD